jgi:hypothetical protein
VDKIDEKVEIKVSPKLLLSVRPAHMYSLSFAWHTGEEKSEEMECETAGGACEDIANESQTPHAVGIFQFADSSMKYEKPREFEKLLARSDPDPKMHRNPSRRASPLSSSRFLNLLRKFPDLH